MTTSSDRIIPSTIDFWQPYSEQPLSEADAQEIITNVSQFIDLLHRWDLDLKSGSAAGRESAE